MRKGALNPADIVIVDYDCLTPAGNDYETAYGNVAAGRYGIKALRGYPHDYIDIGGELDQGWRKAKELRSWTDPASLLLPDLIQRISDRLALPQIFAPEEIGIIAGSAFPGITPLQNLKHVGRTVKGLLCVTGSVPLARVLMKSPFRGEVHYVSTACATGGHATLLARSLLLSQFDTKLFLLCCWDFSMIDVVMQGFHLSKTLFRYRTNDRALNDPGKASRPFSEDRSGLVPAEAVAVLAVTRRDTAERLGLPVRARISGAASSAGAQSHTITNPDSITQSIKRALRGQGRDQAPEPVDLISAHANSTPVGDEVEARALATALGSTLADTFLFCAQEYFGHTFGASVLLQTIMAAEMMRREEVLPMRNYIPDPELPQLRISHRLESYGSRRALVMGIGFGGASVALVIERP